MYTKNYSTKGHVWFVVDVDDREALGWTTDAVRVLGATHEKLLGARIVLQIPLGQARGARR